MKIQLKTKDGLLIKELEGATIDFRCLIKYREKFYVWRSFTSSTNTAIFVEATTVEVV